MVLTISNSPTQRAIAFWEWGGGGTRILKKKIEGWPDISPSMNSKDIYLDSALNARFG